MNPLARLALCYFARRLKRMNAAQLRAKGYDLEARLGRLIAERKPVALVKVKKRLVELEIRRRA
jgi:hypothetical protein